MKISTQKNQQYHCSPLRYPGGKTFLAPFMSEVIEKKGLQNATFIEPFAGGAGASLALLCQNKVAQVVINDLDRAIYSFWRSAIHESERFVQAIRTTPVTIKEWRRQKAIYSNPRAKRFELGFATFFLNRTNISGILNGGPIGGTAQTGRWKIDVRFYKETLMKRILQLGILRSRIKVYHRDGVDLIADYLNRDDVMIYLDPPYFEKGATLYLNHYTLADHVQLAEQLNIWPKSNWIITYDNRREIRALYSKRRIMSYSLFHNAYEARKGKEILILSDAFRRIMNP